MMNIRDEATLFLDVRGRRGMHDHDIDDLVRLLEQVIDETKKDCIKKIAAMTGMQLLNGRSGDIRQVCDARDYIILKLLKGEAENTPLKLVATDSLLNEVAKRKLITCLSMLESVPLKWWGEFRRLLETGEASSEFFESSKPCRNAFDFAMQDDIFLKVLASAAGDT